MTNPAEPSTPSGSSEKSTTKATDHELQKYDIFTRYGHLVRGAKTGCTRHPLVKSNGVVMNKTLTVSLVIATLALAKSSAFARLRNQRAPASFPSTKP